MLCYVVFCVIFYVMFYVTNMFYVILYVMFYVTFNFMFYIMFDVLLMYVCMLERKLRLGGAPNVPVYMNQCAPYFVQIVRSIINRSVSLI